MIKYIYTHYFSIFLVAAICHTVLVSHSQNAIDTVFRGRPEMIFVAGGSFEMGSLLGGSDKRPVHRVTLNSFYIGKYEVTQSLWQQVMGNDGHENYFQDCPDCPVERVSWFGANEFIKRLNLLTTEKYRLPTEAEWEYAAKGGRLTQNHKYSGSDSTDGIAWRNGNSDNMTHQAGQKKCNELGIYDMTGNVWEWCSDWYSETYYSISPTEDPKGIAVGSEKVLRGGSWFQEAFGLNVTDRNSMDPEWRTGFVGFRLCR